MPVTITLEQLKALNACQEVLDSLVAVYGTSATFQTPEELSVAVLNSKKVDWCYKHLLTLKNRDTYEAARKPLLDTYMAARKPLWDTYMAARKPLLDTYMAAKKPLWDTYMAATALIFATIYFEQENRP